MYAAPTSRKILPGHLNGVGNKTQSSPAKGVIASGRTMRWRGDHQYEDIQHLESGLRAAQLFENGNRKIIVFYCLGYSGPVVMRLPAVRD